MPKFSVVTPTWNRADGRLQRCMQSVFTQSYLDWEHVIVDDGSTDDTKQIAQAFPNITYTYQPHAGRVVARNVGMRIAAGEWICWLDSDDAYDSMYLTTLEWLINHNPGCKLWLCGAVVHGMYKENGKHQMPVWTKLRLPQVPPLDESGRWVHAHFPSGTVGTGMFAFHRDCLETTGLLPPWANHNEVADGVDEWLGYETGYNSATKLVGNPYGDDWSMFRKLTQYFRAEKTDAALYVQYVR